MKRKAINELRRRCDLEEQIVSMIRKDNQATCHFIYQDETDESANPLVSLTVITRNPKHHEIFTLFSTQKYSSPIDCLDEVIEYLTKLQTKPNDFFSYKVIWYKKSVSPNELQTSYFYVTNMKELIDKFYEHKDVNEFIIYSISLNPLS